MGLMWHHNIDHLKSFTSTIQKRLVKPGTWRASLLRKLCIFNHYFDSMGVNSGHLIMCLTSYPFQPLCPLLQGPFIKISDQCCHCLCVFNWCWSGIINNIQLTIHLTIPLDMTSVLVCCEFTTCLPHKQTLPCRVSSVGMLPWNVIIAMLRHIRKKETTKCHCSDNNGENSTKKAKSSCLKVLHWWKKKSCG